MENIDDVPAVFNIPYSIEDNYEDKKQKDSLMNALRCMIHYYKCCDVPMLDCVNLLVFRNNMVLPADIIKELGIENSNLDVERTKTYYLKKYRQDITHSKLVYFTEKYNIFLSVLKYISLKMYNNDYNYLKDNLNYIHKKYLSYDEQYNFLFDNYNSLSKTELLVLRNIYFGKDKDIKFEKTKVQCHYDKVRNFYLSTLIEKCVFNMDESNLNQDIWRFIIDDRFSNPYKVVVLKSIIKKEKFRRIYDRLSPYDKLALNEVIENYCEKHYRITKEKRLFLMEIGDIFSRSKTK